MHLMEQELSSSDDGKSIVTRDEHGRVLIQFTVPVPPPPVKPWVCFPQGGEPYYGPQS